MGRHKRSVELVFIVDTSGSMYSEWADVCGRYLRRISLVVVTSRYKAYAEEANMTVYETIYGLGNALPVASQGNCAAKPIPDQELTHWDKPQR